MRKITGLFVMVSSILMLNLTAFSQGKSDTCYYQAPRITCEQAQKNADAIVKFPIALKGLEQKDEMIRLKINELSNVKAGFVAQCKLNDIAILDLTKDYDREVRRKKRWRFITGVLAIVATAFYVK